jgi:L-threonylcarbamoyladenylate synthase
LPCRIKVDPAHGFRKALDRASQCLRYGGIVAFATESFYALGANATSQKAVERLFRVKKRSPDNPVLILISSVDMLSKHVDSLPPRAYQLIEAFWPGGLTLVFKAGPNIPRQLTAGTGKIGIRLSSHPVAAALPHTLGMPVTGTSANISGQPPCRSGEAVEKALGEEVDLILDSGETPGKIGSTILDVTLDPPQILREGMVPKTRLNGFI